MRCADMGICTSDGKNKILASAQRMALVRTSTAYRTVSHGAPCVVTGSMFIYIKAKLQWKKYEAKKSRFSEDRQGEAYGLAEEIKSLKQEVEDRRNIEWTFHNPGYWTRRLIKDPLTFVRKRRMIYHYVMQFLTGRGILNHYRYRIGKENHSSCWDCGDDLDDAEHLLFKCPR